MPRTVRSKLLLHYGTYFVLTETHWISKNFKIWHYNLLQVITLSVDTMTAEDTALLTCITRFMVRIPIHTITVLIFLRVSLFPPDKCENSNLIRPISFTIPYHTVITQYPVRGHVHGANYEPQHKACHLNGYGIAKYRVLTAVMFKNQISGILHCVDKQVFTELSKGRTLIFKVKKTNVVNCLTLKLKTMCSVENSGLHNDEYKTLHYLCRNPKSRLL